MIPLEKLPEVTDNVLSGLTADETLKQKIYSAALHPDLAAFRFSRQRIVTVSCCLALAAVFAFWGVHSGFRKQNEAEMPFQAFSSASHTAASPVFLQEFLTP